MSDEKLSSEFKKALSNVLLGMMKSGLRNKDVCDGFRLRYSDEVWIEKKINRRIKDEEYGMMFDFAKEFVSKYSPAKKRGGE